MDAIASAPALSDAPLCEGRRSYDSLRALGFGPAHDVGAIEDLEIPGPAGTLRARLYRPHSSQQHGLLVHVHGGGFVAGSIEGYDRESRAFAALGECSVLTFNYRLAPEHRFPSALEDTVSAVAWAFENASDLGCDTGRLAVGGDSAGANLAAVAALVARDRGLPLACQILIYPSTDYSREYASRMEFGKLSTLSRADFEWARDQYLSAPADIRDWRVSPLLANSLAGAAPALVLTGECDLLRDEGEAYARRLEADGVATVLRRYEGLPHGFFSMGAFVEAARHAVEETCAYLREALS